MNKNIQQLMKFERDFGLKHIEVWVWVKDFEGLYKVSNLGNVMNVKSGKILKQATMKIGYKKVSLWKNNKGTSKYVHRLVAEAFLSNPNEKSDVDHINRTRTDTNLLNLRWSTHSENLMNMSMHKNNSSGVTGVHWYEKRDKWHSQIMFNRKNKFLGYFDDYNDAVRARKEAELKYFGEFRNKTL